MKVIGYIRVSTDKQDLRNQEHAILSYAHSRKLSVDEFIKIEISSTKSARARRVGELIEKMQEGGTLIVTELSRLGRNMLETLNIIEQLSIQGVEIIFVNQQELSLQKNNPHVKLLYAIYGYFAEAERVFISTRTKQGLAAAKSRGITLGRPKGATNKRGRVLDRYQDQIEKYLRLELSVAAIRKIVNSQLERELSYNTYRNYVNLLKKTTIKVDKNFGIVGSNPIITK